MRNVVSMGGVGVASSLPFVPACDGGSATTGGKTGTGGAEVDESCRRFCDERVKLGCVGDDTQCRMDCATVVGACSRCAAEVRANYECLTSALAPACDESKAFDACRPSYDAYIDCFAGPCVTPSCTSDPTSCACTQACGAESYAVECVANSPGLSYDCTCYDGGQVVGTCKDETAYACDPSHGCCAVHFSQVVCTL